MNEGVLRNCWGEEMNVVQHLDTWRFVAPGCSMTTLSVHCFRPLEQETNSTASSRRIVGMPRSSYIVDGSPKKTENGFSASCACATEDVANFGSRTSRRFVRRESILSRRQENPSNELQTSMMKYLLRQIFTGPSNSRGSPCPLRGPRFDRLASR